MYRKGITLFENNNRLKNPCKTESRLLKLGIESYKTKNAPVAVKIQKPTESISEAVNLLKTAGKKCSVTILIRTQNDDLIRNINIPSNMEGIELNWKIRVMVKNN